MVSGHGSTPFTMTWISEKMPIHQASFSAGLAALVR